MYIDAFLGALPENDEESEEECSSECSEEQEEEERRLFLFGGVTGAGKKDATTPGAGAGGDRNKNHNGTSTGSGDKKKKKKKSSSTAAATTGAVGGRANHNSMVPNIYETVEARSARLRHQQNPGAAARNRVAELSSQSSQASQQATAGSPFSPGSSASSSTEPAGVYKCIALTVFSIIHLCVSLM